MIKISAISKLDFLLMIFCIRIRDFLCPRMQILQEVGLRKGFHVLDYGCGPGSYIVPLRDLVGESGRIYALDSNSFAVRRIERLAAKKGFSTVQTILSDCATGLPPESVDVVLFYDILHHFENPDGVLHELHRILKHSGILSVSDHHLNKKEIITRVTGKGLYKLSATNKKVINFNKV